MQTRLGTLAKTCAPALAAVALFSHLIPAEAAMPGTRTVSLDLRPSPSHRTRLLKSAAGVSAGEGRTSMLPGGSADAGVLSVGDEIALTLFDDVSLTLVLRKKMPSPAIEGDVFLAKVEDGGAFKDAVVIRTADGITADIHDYAQEKVYRVVSTADGVKVEEREASRAGECGCGGTIVPEIPAATASNSRRLLSAAAQPNGKAVIDILVAYDAKARAWVEGDNNGGMDVFAAAQVAKMNTVVANNLLDEKFEFRLVGTVAVSASSTNLDDALEKARTGAAGWTAIKAKRDEVGADIVSVLVDTGSDTGNTGLGYSLEKNHSPVSTFSEHAYNCCAIRAVAKDHSMTHECGHNMGAGHSSADAVDTSKIDPGPQYDSFSSGYYFQGSSNGKWYHTIMAYNFDGRGNYYTGVPVFSSTFRKYDGTTVGDETTTTRRRFSTRTPPSPRSVRRKSSMSRSPAQSRRVTSS